MSTYRERESKKPRNRRPASGRAPNRERGPDREGASPVRSATGGANFHHGSEGKWRGAMQLGRERARRSTETGGAVTKSGNLRGGTHSLRRPQAATQSTAVEDEVCVGEDSELRRWWARATTGGSAKEVGVVSPSSFRFSHQRKIFLV